ncbi:uncharacterized protein LY89DRAFT_684623 [Mollisia scopiformis]|uniref:Uncharacterized protein n=1 Tax=Mollisia scopiformis TaxID=149040 RepID=A0A194XBU6_MOLSC|nr:uncharacterized protein LY89DRAFT_684623 [Mollisia scopiformis]KUJ17631.1 hypothetical protein LY89DRAFT_684623 [Mollisia scopiformis]
MASQSSAAHNCLEIIIVGSNATCGLVNDGKGEPSISIQPENGSVIDVFLTKLDEFRREKALSERNELLAQVTRLNEQIRLLKVTHESELLLSKIERQTAVEEATELRAALNTGGYLPDDNPLSTEANAVKASAKVRAELRALAEENMQLARKLARFVLGEEQIDDDEGKAPN